MELLTPDIGLIIWSITSIIFLGLVAYAVYHLANNKNIPPSQKLLWLIAIIVVPLFGAVIYLGTKKAKGPVSTPTQRQL
jgi:hypothetical protein